MLSAKQEAFCLHYAKTGNAPESYKAAGYVVSNENTANACASRLLKRANVKERIEELRREVARPAIMDIAEMQERLSAIGRGETFEEVLTNRGDIVEKRVSEADAIRAITQLAKMQGVSENVKLNIAPIVFVDDLKE